jgi:hypothetical protein
VRGHRVGDMTVTRPVSGVTVTVNGAQANNETGNTRGDGRKGFGPYRLNAGLPYTVGLQFPPALTDKYDIANIAPGPPQTQNLQAGAVTQFAFLAPWHWIEFQVRDSQNRAVSKLPYVLRHQPLIGGNWTEVERGQLPANGNIAKDEIPNGRYRLSIPLLSNPTWSNASVATGTLQTLSVTVTGVEAGDAGEFQIVDAFDDSKVIHTIVAQVTGAGPNFQMQVNWAPSAVQLGALTQSWIAFKARCGGAETLSERRQVTDTQMLNVNDASGNPVVTAVTVYFSGGTSWNGNSVNGVAIVNQPWKEQIVRVDLTALQRWRTNVQGGGQMDGAITKP